MLSKSQFLTEQELVCIATNLVVPEAAVYCVVGRAHTKKPESLALQIERARTGATTVAQIPYFFLKGLDFCFLNIKSWKVEVYLHSQGLSSAYMRESELHLVHET